MAKSSLYIPLTCTGAAAALLVLYLLPGHYNWTDAKIAFPVGALAGYCVAYLIDRWTSVRPDAASKREHQEGGS